MYLIGSNKSWTNTFTSALCENIKSKFLDICTYNRTQSVDDNLTFMISHPPKTTRINTFAKPK